MRATKDSGVDWLGEIPRDWEVRKFRNVFKESSEVNGTEPVGPMLSISSYHGVQVKEYASENLQRDSDQLENYRVVRPHQLAVNTMWLNYGGLGVSNTTGHMSPAYRAYWIIEGLYPRYVHHLMRSGLYVLGYTALLTGVRPNSLQMSRDSLMGFPILLPPLEEQRAIADFLDRETAKIDTLIAKQEQLITTLGERREEVVSRLSTQGIGGQSDLVESGIDWLPKIPSNWAPDKMSRIFKPKKGSNAAMLTAEYCGTVEGEYPVYSGQTSNDGVMASIESYEFESPDDGFIFTTTVGARAMSVSKIYGRFSLSQNCMILENKAVSRICTDFARWQLETMFSRKKSEVSSHMQPSFTMADLREYWMAIPSLAEQLEIVRLISSEVLGVEQLVKKSLKIVETLCERRQSLISAAVTGKIDLSEGA